MQSNATLAHLIGRYLPDNWQLNVMTFFDARPRMVVTAHVHAISNEPQPFYAIHETPLRVTRLAVAGRRRSIIRFENFSEADFRHVAQMLAQGLHQADAARQSEPRLTWWRASHHPITSTPSAADGDPMRLLAHRILTDYADSAANTASSKGLAITGVYPERWLQGQAWRSLPRPNQLYCMAEISDMLIYRTYYQWRWLVRTVNKWTEGAEDFFELDTLHRFTDEDELIDWYQQMVEPADVYQILLGRLPH